MPLNFPSSPSLNDTYSFGGKTWIWNGSAWDIQTQGAINNTPIGNITPNTGAFTTLSATGNITGNYFIGNGSLLTGIVSGSITTVSSTAPVSPSQGDIWIDSDTGTQFIYFNDGNSSQWAEMEAAQSFSSGADFTAVSSNILPTANITYDIGNSSNRFRDIYLANSTIYLGDANISADGNAIVLPANTSVGGTIIKPNPTITSLDYPGDDTAAAPAGGQTIGIVGTGFESGCTVYIDLVPVGVTTFISSTLLSFTSPAKSPGSYTLYVVNPDGTTALAVPGIQYSGTPTWSTGAGSLGTPYETDAFAVTLTATGDAPLTYSVATSNSLPANLTLNSSTGNLSGTVPVTENDTTYNFYVDAIDAELQETARQFSVTYKKDVVTWDSPANASSYSWTQGSANSVALTATSAAGKAITYTVQSGSLPANVSISGSSITGTPNTIQSNTSVVIRATASDTGRYADRTLYFTVAAAGPTVIGEAYGGGYYAGKITQGGSTYYLIVAPKSSGESSSKQWKTTNSAGPTATQTLNNGPAASAAMDSASYPAAQFCEGLTIGGYSDWYLPARDELELCYRNLKPTTNANETYARPKSSITYPEGNDQAGDTMGINRNSDPAGAAYTSGSPAQTSVTVFQSGGAEAFASAFYWSSSDYSSTYAWIQVLNNGYQDYDNKTNSNYVRAIRRVPV